MAKRDREISRQVILQGFGVNTKAEDIGSVFCKFGRIESIKFLGRRNCLVQFEQTESALKCLQLHNTKQSGLYTSLLSVTLNDNNKPVKKSHHPPGSFILLDPPRFNNYLIPVLPSFLSS